MANRIVYLVEDMPLDVSGCELELVTDEALSSLVNDGFEIASSTKRSITIAGAKVPATMFVLTAPEDVRRVSRVPDPEPRSGHGLITVRDDWGHEVSVSPAQEMVRQVTNALSRLGAAGHLGPAGNHQIPGMQVIPGELVAQAFDAGALAANAGKTAESCPFPLGSAPAVKWLAGFRSRMESMKQPPSKAARKEAEEAGFQQAKALGPDDEAHCPYADAQLEKDWQKGFQRGGGRILPK